MRIIIFLDIDGVLNPKWWNGQKPSDKYGVLFDYRAIACLGEIIAKTDAELVISSSWKDMGLAELKNMWRDRNLPGKIIGITPDYMSDEMLLNPELSELNYLYNRGCEIEGWLAQHRDDVSRYVIIDDMDDVLPEHKSHFVQTDPEVGITGQDADKAIRILTQ